MFSSGYPAKYKFSPVFLTIPFSNMFAITINQREMSEFMNFTEIWIVSGS